MLRTITHLGLVGLFAAAPLWAQSPRASSAVEEGIAALKAERWDEAEARFQQALKTGGGPAALIRHNLGLLRQRRGAHEDAVAEFRQAARLQPDSGQTHLLLGVSLLALDRGRDAVAALERAVKLLPDEEQAHGRLALAYERTEQWADAVVEYQWLSERRPQDAESLYRLGRAYSRLSEWAYQRIIALDPDAARLHQALGKQYLSQGRYELALAEYRRAAEVDARLPEIHLAMALIHLEQRNFTEAQQEIDLELRLAPHSRLAREVRQKILSQTQKD